MRRLGLIGGMSWESSAEYYRLLNERTKDRLGGLHSADLLLLSLDFEPIARRQFDGDWEALADDMATAARRLERAGADALLLCTNTMHKLAGEIEAAVSIPLIHIADATARAVRRAEVRRPILLATRYTMEEDFYRGRLLDQHGIEAITPDAEGREMIHRVIYEELCRGIVDPRAKRAFIDEVDRLKLRGADGVILGCTEIGLLLTADDLPLPCFETVSIHVDAALDFACA